MKTDKPLLYRQGDVILRRVDRIPAKSKPVKRTGDVILAQGTHTHRLKDKKAETFTGEDGATYLSVGGKSAKLVHEEHIPPIGLPVGAYEVIRQQEWIGEGARNVED